MPRQPPILQQTERAGGSTHPHSFTWTKKADSFIFGSDNRLKVTQSVLVPPFIYGGFKETSADMHKIIKFMIHVLYTL